ncbi:MAG: hypothetical protein AB7S26_29925 [Sandaracinaceae bacterium]
MTKYDRHRRALVLLASFALAACGGGTAAGTELLDLDASSDMPAEHRPAEPPPEGVVEVVDGPGEGSRIEFAIAAIAVPDGGRYVHHVRVSVEDSGGWELSASAVGGPTNGGTVEAPIHQRIILVTATKSGVTGSESHQASYRVSADGSITAI